MESEDLFRGLLLDQLPGYDSLPFKLNIDDLSDSELFSPKCNNLFFNKLENEIDLKLEDGNNKTGELFSPKDNTMLVDKLENEIDFKLEEDNKKYEELFSAKDTNILFDKLENEVDFKLEDGNKKSGEIEPWPWLKQEKVEEGWVLVSWCLFCVALFKVVFCSCAPDSFYSADCCNCA
jgi:hypothetical protein